jgi:Outer membrane protein
MLMENAPTIVRTARGRSRSRGWMAAFALLALVTGPAALPGESHALELFGFKLFGAKDDDALPVVDPLTYTVTIDLRGGEGGDVLKDRLLSASGLARGAEKPVSGSVGLISLARSDFEQLLGALYEDARYGGVVDISLAGRPLESLAPDADLKPFEPVPVTISVTPGPQFRFGTVAVVTDEGKAFDPATYGLVSGGTAGSDTILVAEGKVVDALRALGHPLAKVTSRDVVADHERTELDVTLHVSPGPIAPFGETSVDGASEVDPDFVAYMAGVEEGKTYDPKDLEAATKRLKALDVFSSVTVRGRDTLDANGAVPVDVAVSERKFRYFGAGATFSSTDGGGLEAYWGHRNLFGRAEKLRVEGAVSRLGNTGQYQDLTYRGALLFEKPGVLGPASKFSSRLVVAQENPDAYRRFSINAFAGVSRELSDRDTVSVGVDVEYARLTDAFVTNRKTLTVALPIEYVRDARDDRLNPTSGYRFLIAAEPTIETINSETFLKVRGELSAYRALDEAKRFVLAGRVAGGAIVGSDLAGVPANRRFYAGGGGSVRGYGYQGIGPRDVNGKPTGGLSHFEASAEVRINVTENVGVVPFIDVGMVGSDYGFDDARLKAGAGIGLRYNTPFGPLRVDFALPLDREPGDPKYGIYAGVGQAF